MRSILSLLLIFVLAVSPMHADIMAADESGLGEQFPALQEPVHFSGNPTRDLVFITISYFVGYMPLVLMPPTLNQMPNVSKSLKGFMTGLPPVIAGVLRIITGRHTDQKGGRAAFIVPLGVSFVGLLVLASFNYALGEEGLKELTDEDWAILLIPMGGAVLAGTGLSTYSVAAAMSSYSGSKESAAGRQAISGGLGNLAPGMALLMFSFLLKVLPLHYAYFITAGVELLGTTGAVLGLNPSRYHQLLARGHDAESARQIAETHGQEMFPDLTTPSLLHTFLLRDFDGKGKLILFNLVMDYIAITGTSFALTTFLPLALKTRMGFSPESALLLGGVFSMVTALSRAGSGFLASRFLHGHNKLLSYVSLAGVGIGGLGLFASGTYAPTVFGFAVLVALSQGLGKYAVVGRVKDLLQTRIGVALGFLGCFPSLLSPLLSGAMGSLSHLDQNDGGEEDWGGVSWEYLVLPGTAVLAIVLNLATLPRASR
ncbi:MAG: MFS transporter [Deltaproteobacteria bacterium]|nr:MFS transporter [Deltaproteobacteria bacterium]